MDFEGVGYSGAGEMKRSRVAATGAGSSSVDLVALADHVEKFADKTVVVLGDFVADEFQFGEISRVSREAPVLILRHRETQVVPGGCANAANNFAALGARVLPVTVVGHDAAGDALVAYFRERRMDLSGVVRVKGFTTPTKTRFLAGWAHTVAQQVLRVDREPQGELPASVRDKIARILRAKLRRADVLAVSDYGFGVASPDLVRAATAKKKSLVTTLDSRYGLGSYAKTGITSATPNEAELETLHHTSIGRDTAELERCGRETLTAMKLDSLLVTRGRDGMALFESPTRAIAHSDSRKQSGGGCDGCGRHGPGRLLAGTWNGRFGTRSSAHCEHRGRACCDEARNSDGVAGGIACGDSRRGFGSGRIGMPTSASKVMSREELRKAIADRKRGGDRVVFAERMLRHVARRTCAVSGRRTARRGCFSCGSE